MNRSVKLSVLLLFIIVVLSLVTSGAYFNGEELRKKIISIISFISFYCMLSLHKDTDISHRINFKHIYYSAIALSIGFAVDVLISLFHHNLFVDSMITLSHFFRGKAVLNRNQLFRIKFAIFPMLT